MSSDKALKNKFDKRLIEIYINRGLVAKEDYEKHLSELPDLAHNVEMIGVNADADLDESEENQH